MNSATKTFDLALRNVSREYTMTLCRLLRAAWEHSHHLAYVVAQLKKYIEDEVDASSSLVVSTLAESGMHQIEWVLLTKRWIRQMQVEAESLRQPNPFPGLLFLPDEKEEEYE